MRVYELASILGLTNEKMINILEDNNIFIENYMSIIDDSSKKIIEGILTNNNLESHNNQSSIKSLYIEGLFGKYDYNIDFNNNVNIFISENGSGKTTILKILLATIEGNEEQLKKLPFNSLKLYLDDKEICINKNELNEYDEYDEYDRFLKRKLFDNLREHIPFRDYDRIRRNIMRKKFDFDEVKFILERLRYNGRYDFEINWLEVEDILSELKFKYDIYNDNNVEYKLSTIRKSIKEDILYFPTYRRIETDLEIFGKSSDKEKMRLRGSNINFGMKDVERNIYELTNKLKDDAMNYYSDMNAQILDDLLSDELELSTKEKINIDSEKVKIIIGRIGEDKIKQRDELMRFIENKSQVANREFLEYYLFQLIKIFEKQKPIDDKIKRFKNICNRYLVNKEIVYNEVTTEVVIERKCDRQPIKFNDLSSGEKQILSLFAKLYLDTSKQTIFIIDEPELSLSIIWQKSILEDIYNSGKVSLLIATTHSPYIYKNKFRSFVRDMNIYKSEVVIDEF